MKPERSIFVFARRTLCRALALAFAAMCCASPSPAFGAAGTGSSAQNPRVEQIIRNLEQAEAKAVLAKDATALEKLWDAGFVVNSPDNRVVLPGKTTVDRPVMNKPRASFSRAVEHITVRGNIAISMGSETLVPAGDLPRAGQTVQRRYTNIWMKLDGAWKLVARHANEIPTN